MVPGHHSLKTTHGRSLGRPLVVCRAGGQPTPSISRNARISKLLQRLGTILRDLEERDNLRVNVLRPLGGQDDSLIEELEDLGVQYASCLSMPGSGHLRWTMEGNGGVIDSEGSALPQWIEEWLRDPKRQDVILKLRRTSAQERWVFVPVVFGGAPWSVESYLTDEFEYLPATSPNLPSPVTGIWVTSTFGT